jgi:predicted nucleotidyltransferase
VATDWEDRFRRWSGRASDTEDDKRERTERAVREAIADSPELAGRKVRVFAKGSYKNNTNVRLDSDVDVAVEFQEVFYWEATNDAVGMSGADLGITPYSGSYPPGRFKDDVESALVNRFGSSAVDRGNKAIHVREDGRSLAADVVPCFTFHRYDRVGHNGVALHHEGIQIHPDSGGRIENWPEQNYERGVAKNNATGQRYKRVVRILKRLENDMVEKGISAEVPSFLTESLVYNVPNEGFRNYGYQANVGYALAHLYNGTLEGGGPSSGWRSTG